MRKTKPRSLLLRTMDYMAETERKPYLLEESERRACAGRFGYLHGYHGAIRDDEYQAIGFAIAGRYHGPGRPGWIPAFQAEAIRIAEIAESLDKRAYIRRSSADPNLFDLYVHGAAEILGETMAVLEPVMLGINSKQIPPGEVGELVRRFLEKGTPLAAPVAPFGPMVLLPY